MKPANFPERKAERQYKAAFRAIHTEKLQSARTGTPAFDEMLVVSARIDSPKDAHTLRDVRTKKVRGARTSF